MSIWRGDEHSDLKTSKSHANVVSFDENESSLSALMNLYERNEQFLDICVMDNFSCQEMLSTDHIAGSSLELIKFIFWKLTTDKLLVFDWITGSCQVTLLLSGPGCSEDS